MRIDDELELIGNLADKAREEPPPAISVSAAVMKRVEELKRPASAFSALWYVVLPALAAAVIVVVLALQSSGPPDDAVALLVDPLQSVYLDRR